VRFRPECGAVQAVLVLMIGMLLFSVCNQVILLIFPSAVVKNDLLVNTGEDSLKSGIGGLYEDERYASVNVCGSRL
jgi:hypothetical protein